MEMLFLYPFPQHCLNLRPSVRAIVVCSSRDEQLVNWKMKTTSLDFLFLRRFSFVLTSLVLVWSSASWASVPRKPFVPVKPEIPKRFCEEQMAWLEKAEQAEEWTEITKMKGIVVRLAYASFDNFTGHDLYCGNNRAFLHTDAARKLEAAVAALQEQRPGFKLLVLDAGRPRHAQQALFDAVRKTPYRRFMTDPREGSVHAYGMAVDVTILDASGKPLDMGTSYDDLEARSGEIYELQALREGSLTQQQVDNRKLLRTIMRAGGFKYIDLEWWHFNADKSAAVHEWYEQLD